MISLLMVRWAHDAECPAFVAAIEYRPVKRGVRRAPPSLRLPSAQYGLTLAPLPEALADAIGARADG